VIDMLDEESRFPKGTDQTYLEKLVAAHGKHKNFSKSKQAGSTFGVIHYAGEVQYLITNFLDKNKDEVSELMFEALKKTKIDLVRTLSDQKKEADDDSRTAKKKQTVASNFRSQLLSLVQVLGSTAPQYVRCIKPNSQKSAFLWDDELVLAQLRYSGMLETIRIRKAGYAWRVPFPIFFQKYKVLVKLAGTAEPRELCKKILDQLKLSSDHWQLGKTKVFMRNSVFIPLQDALDKHIKKCAIIVTKVIKGNYYRQRYKRIRANVQLVQKCVRMFTKRRLYLRRQKAAVSIQAVVRGWFARDYYEQLKREKKEREERERKEREARLKREAEEAEKRRVEEEARRSREAADAEKKRQVDEKKRLEEEAKKSAEEAAREAARLKKEEAEILKLTKAAMSAKEGGGEGSEAVGEMFSFLNVVDKGLVGETGQNAGLEGLDDELEEIFENGAKVLRKRKSGAIVGGAGAAAGQSDAEIYEKLKKRGEGKTDAARAMKSNPLLARKGDDKDEHSENETMAAFAAKYFEEHDKLMGGTIANTLSRKKKKVTLEEMLCFTRQPIPLSMLKVTVPADDARHDKMVTVAIEIFREGLRIGDANLKSTDPSIPPMIQNVVKLGIGVPELRDEILVQVVRQCTENPADLKNWDIIAVRYWQLLAVCLSCFPPSKTLAKPLRNFLRVNADFDEEAEEKRTVADPGRKDSACRPGGLLGLVPLRR
jgi:myosin VIIa